MVEASKCGHAAGQTQGVNRHWNGTLTHFWCSARRAACGRVADSTSWGESPEMCRKTHTATLTPAGLAIDGVEIGATKIIVTARPSMKIATCPECGVVSGRIHSRYRRRLIDLPCARRKSNPAILVV
jgi:hypothetical protein